MNRVRAFGLGAATAMAIAVSAALLSASAQAPAGAQTARESKPATGVIVGTAVDASTGKPIAGSIVTISGSSTPQARVLTGSDGRFMFAKLQAGSYSLLVGHSGYFPGQYGSISPGRGGVPVDLADGERRTDIVIKMWKNAAITGRVTDEAGDPVVNVNVQGWSRQRTMGVPAGAWAAQQTARTDDRGVYRLSGLVPGEWLVFIEQASTSVPLSVLDAFQQARPDSTNPLMNEVFGLRGGINPPGNVGARQVGDHIEVLSSTGGMAAANGEVSAAYASQFFPSAAAPSAATAIALGSGEERRGIDMQLRAVRTVRVSGTVTGPSGPVALTRVTLVPQQLSTASVVDASSMTDANGRFTFLRVPEGQHLLQLLSVPPVRSNAVTTLVQNADGTVSASSISTLSASPVLPPDPTLFAEMAIATSDKDIDNVAVIARHGPRVKGRIEPPAGTAVSAAMLERITVSLRHLDGRGFDFYSAPRVRVDDTGEVTSQGFEPGRYTVSASVLPPTWALASVMHGGVDVSQQPLELTSDVDDLVFNFTTSISQLSGVVHDDRGAIISGALVMIFPADAPLTDEVRNPRRVVRPIASSSGKYSTRNLPAGDYYVAAMAPDDPENISAPAGGQFSVESLTRLRDRAMRIKIGNGEQRVLDLVAKGR